MEPLISVIVPIYNSENYLSHCIKSIINQTHSNLQIILINDGSTDQSFEICNDFARRDSRIVVKNIENSGVSSARNHGLDLSIGDYIGFVDSDDCLEHNFYETLLQNIQANDSDACTLISYTIKSPSAYVLKKKNLTRQESIKELFLLRFPTSLWAYLYKKETLTDIRLNEEIHFFEDFEFNYRVMNKINKVSICEEKHYHYREHDQSTNNQLLNYKRMTCLNIYSQHKKNINNLESELSKYADFFRSHFLITTILSYVKTKQVNRKFKLQIHMEIEDLLKENVFSKYIPIKYKIAILLFKIHPKLLSILTYRRRNQDEMF